MHTPTCVYIYVCKFCVVGYCEFVVLKNVLRCIRAIRYYYCVKKNYFRQFDNSNSIKPFHSALSICIGPKHFTNQLKIPSRLKSIKHGVRKFEFGSVSIVDNFHVSPRHTIPVCICCANAYVCIYVCVWILCSRVLRFCCSEKFLALYKSYSLLLLCNFFIFASLITVIV